MWNNIVTWIKANWRPALSWARRNIFWVAIVAIILFILISLRGCSSSPTPTSPAPGSGWLFLKLAFAGLVLAAYGSRERPYLAFTFSGLAVLIFLVLLGKFDGLFVWAVLGLPLFATAGIYGATKAEGRTRSFLEFASGILILFWMFLLYLGHADKIKIGFLGTLFPDDTAKIIFTVALAIFLFATWKRSTIFYCISFVVLLSFLGKATVNEIFNRFPEKLTPTVSKETKETWEDAWTAFLNKLREAVKPVPVLPQSTLPPASSTPPPPAPQATVPKRFVKIRFPLDFFTGEKVTNQGNCVEIRNGGYAVFRYSDLPWQKGAKYYIVFSIIRKTTGKHHFEVNDGQGGTFFLDHFASERVETCVFNFNSPGQSQFFHPGDNRFKISSPGDNIVIQNAYVHMEYWS